MEAQAHQTVLNHKPKRPRKTLCKESESRPGEGQSE